MQRKMSPVPNNNSLFHRRRFYSNKSTNLFFVLKGGGNPRFQTFLLGICLGLTSGITFIPFFDPECDPTHQDIELGSTKHQLTTYPPQLLPLNSDAEGQGELLEVERRSRRKREVVLTPVLLRPRFMSTELGLRRKLVVGVVLSDPLLLERIIRINQTLAHKVDKIIFFINGTSTEANGTIQQLRERGLSGIVPIELNVGANLTYSVKNREFVTNHVALRAIKYFGEKFRNQFDYFYLTLDEFYVNGRNLLESLKRISVKEDLLWGIPPIQTSTNQVARNHSCQLASGFVMSRRVLSILAMRVSRCYKSGILQGGKGGNLSECVEYVAPHLDCRIVAENQVYSVVSLETTRKIFHSGVIAIGPILTPQSFLEIHQKFCKARKVEIDIEIARHRSVMREMAPKIPKEWQKLHWPLGISHPIRPLNRFDLSHWIFFTKDSIYFQDQLSTATPLGNTTSLDAKDIDNVLEGAETFLRRSTFNHFENLKFSYGFKRFTPTRGMEYLLDYKDNVSGKILRIEGLRPLLGFIEIVPVPFTTESKRLILILTLTTNNKNQAVGFFKYWSETWNDHRRNTTNLIIVLPSPLLTPAEMEQITDIIKEFNSRDRMKVSYTVVKLDRMKDMMVEVVEKLGKLSLITSSSLLLLLEPNIRLKDDFLNRVRLNTISGSQIFSPIPFLQFHPNISEFKEIDEAVEINKNNGYFNTKDFRILSFYYADFLSLEKLGHMVSSQQLSLIQLFLRTSLTIFRATEPNLQLRSSYEDVKESDLQIAYSDDSLIGSRAQIAKILHSTGVL